MEKKITVTGHGAVHVVPDITRLTVSINSHFKTYQDAYDQAKENFAWMVKILEYNNKPGKIAKTTRMDISEHNESVKDNNGYHIYYKKNGYNLEQSIKIDLGIDNVLVNKIVRGIGKFIADAQINIGYTVQDPRPHQLKMLKRAVIDAKEKAEIMAEALGCTLADVCEINYSHEEIHIYSQARNIHSAAEAKASTAEALEITPEDLVVSDDVKVEWILDKAEC
ncbi:MAG: SIMPL domain-containing protein [Paludibacteraceae bacterium]|nr:SIMPL domain-containing protein [Paludibacteraceae bacterium]